MEARIALAVQAALALAAPASAQDLSQLRSWIFLRGTCERLVIAGKDVTGACRETVVNMTYHYGRSSFGFSDGSARMVSFSGTEQIREGDVVRQTLDAISIATQGALAPDVASAPASGTCIFSDPYRGRSFIRCSARTRDGEFAASFTSNGEPPQVHEF